MASPDFVVFALQMTAMLGAALLFGQLMRRLRQPAVLGEMIGGIVLGPTVFGAFAPAAHAWLFASSADATLVREASVKLGMLFFLFVAGMETNVAELRRIGRRAVLIGLLGTLLPIAAGTALVHALPRELWGATVQPHFAAFALFVGMNLANSANPVIARILMDLGMLRTEIGATIMAATVVDDLVNWLLFALILSAVTPASPATPAPLPLAAGLVVAFSIATLGLGRFLASRLLASAGSGPALIGGAALVILVCAGAAEQLGIHAFFGAFLAGLSLSSSDRNGRPLHEVMSAFAMSFFAPLYFVSMGLGADFATDLDLTATAILLAAALITKVGAVLIGARLAGMPLGRETLAIAVGLNARGATGIILAGVGRSSGVIDTPIFAAMMVMCLVTSLIAAPAMNLLLHPPPPPRRT